MAGRGVVAFLIRFAALVGACAWIGGFMFYGGVVVPILDDTFGSLDAGMITRRVTVGLNAIGIASLAALGVVSAIEWRQGPRWIARARLALLVISALGLIALLVLHGVMDSHLDSRGIRGFRPLHRLYLKISTAQWVLNLGILALSLGVWTRLGRTSPGD